MSKVPKIGTENGPWGRLLTFRKWWKQIKPMIIRNNSSPMFIRTRDKKCCFCCLSLPKSDLYNRPGGKYGDSGDLSSLTFVGYVTLFQSGGRLCLPTRIVPTWSEKFPPTGLIHINHQLLTLRIKCNFERKII